MAKVSKDVGQVVITPTVTLTQKQIDDLLQIGRDSKMHMAELLFSMMKWLFTSQLAINGAAAIAIIDSDRISARSLLWAEVWFVSGTVLALLSVFFAMFYFLRFVPDLGRLVLLHPGVHEEAKIEEITSGPDAEEPWNDPVVWIGALPTLCFLIGVAIVVEGTV